MAERETLLTCPILQGMPCQDGHQAADVAPEGQQPRQLVPLCRFYNVPLQRCDLVTLAAAWADLPRELQKVLPNIAGSSLVKLLTGGGKRGRK